MTICFGLMMRQHSFANSRRLSPFTIWKSDDEPNNQSIGRGGNKLGAKYVEADDSMSKKEFLRSIATCKKKPVRQEFLRMTLRAIQELEPQARKFWMENRELDLIF